ncbi:MAG: tRNA uridine-5-carboxymethylaminomethyl(34) synthesis GTPase MnmE, partial [Candidatus Omnitrophota bacterium]
MVTRLSDEDTIVAIATPPGEGGIGIVRLSGARAVEIADSFFRAKSARTLARQSAGSLLFGRVVVQDGSKEGRTVDEVLALVMRGPRSYTREDVVEIHAHGGTAVLRKILELAYRFGARAAEKGEFTKRAFLNGRLDLIQAEAVADLIRAKTDLARQWASAQLGGALSATLRGLRDELLDVLSQLEASIDFSEEEIAPASLEEIRARLDHTAKSLQKTLTGAEAGLLVKRGLGVAIYGRPNTGKSSLLNRLTGIDRAIVTPHAGTTRDVVEAEMQIRGLVLRLSDTAGVQETSNPIERQGVERSKKAV